MDFLEYMVKILIMLLSLLAMAVPFLFTALRIRLDKNAKTRHKHLRVFVFSLIYCTVLTVGLTLISNFYHQITAWAMSVDFLKRLAQNVSVDGRVEYCVTIFGAILLNAGIGFLYLFVQNLARAGLKSKDLSKPRKKDGTFSALQRVERGLIKRINNETGALAGRILKSFNIIISLIYLVLFALVQIPAFSDASWIPYEFLASLFKAGYMLPVLTMLPLWELYWLLSGIQYTARECPALVGEEKDSGKVAPPDLNAARTECNTTFESYHVVDFKIPEASAERPTTNNDHPVTDLIARAIKNDERFGRDPDPAYLNATDKLFQSNVNLLIKGSLYSEFGMYFIRYLNMILAQGGTLVLLCNNDEEIRATYDYLQRAFSVICGLYFSGLEKVNVNLDTPIWGIARVCGNCDTQEDSFIDDYHILITTPDYICSAEFETQHEDFIRCIHDVIMVNTYRTLNMHAARLSMMNTRFHHVIQYNCSCIGERTQASRYQARPLSDPIRYICFDDSNIPGLDRVLHNLIDPPRLPGQDASQATFRAVDCMSYRENTDVTCFNYGPPRGEDGVAHEISLFPTTDYLASVFNISYHYLTRGFRGVYLYTEDAIPFRDMIDSAISNDARLATEFDNARFHLNQYNYNPDAYDVIVAIDGRNNLPATIRKYANLAGDRKMLVNVVSKPYMLRDYYAYNIEKIWDTEQTTLIPVCDSTERDASLRILIKANSGGITEDELFDIALGEKSFEEAAKARDTRAILLRVLTVFDVAIDTGDVVYDYFEFVTIRDFNDSGKYCQNTRLRLRQQGKLYDFLEGRHLTRLTTRNNSYTLPLPKNRISQRYIPQQNMLYNGTLYRINAIDVRHGVIDVLQATGGQNTEAYEYIQHRLYRVELSSDPNSGCTLLQSPRHVIFNGTIDDISVTDAYVSIWRAPTEVVTLGYTAIDAHTFERNDKSRKYPGSGCQYVDLTSQSNRSIAMQSYRRYGALKNSYYKTDRDQSDFIRYGAQLSESGAKVLSLRLCGKFGGKGDRVACLAATAFGEMMRTIFPDLCDSIAVVPVLSDNTLLDTEDGCTISRLQPQLQLSRDQSILDGLRGATGKEEGGEIVELMLIEDSSSDLGVISMMEQAGTSPLQQLFSRLLPYLEWYFTYDGSKKGISKDYLYFGMDHEPECFDFSALYSLACILGDDNCIRESVEAAPATEYESCAFCGRKYAKGSGCVTLKDGRIMCPDCAAELVGNDKKALRNYLLSVKRFMENSYDVVLDDDFKVCFDSTLRIVNMLRSEPSLQRRGQDVPLKGYIDGSDTIHVERDIPPISLCELLVRQLTYAWQLRNLPEMPDDLAEGQIALVGVQYLRHAGQTRLADLRTTYYEGNDQLSGEGYRKLVRELIKQPKYRNNSFRLLSDMLGGGVDFPEDPEKPTDLGELYTPQDDETDERATEGTAPAMFFRSRLSAVQQTVYDQMLEAAKVMTTQITVDSSIPFAEIEKAFNALTGDHPELFYLLTGKMTQLGNVVSLYYDLTTPPEQLRAQIEAAIPAFTEGITPEMSAYDIALRLHSNLIDKIDYDTVALREEEREGYDNDHIDRLRSICGVFLDNAAVCAGYARALQLLLHRYGIEAGYCTGMITPEHGGGGHAWIIVKLYGEYYYIDPTWDDRSDTVQVVKKRNKSYNYFCITTEELLRSRDTSLSPTELPLCTATKCNYFYHNDAVLKEYDLEKIKTIAANAVKRGAKDFAFKCASPEVYAVAKQHLCAESKDGFAILKELKKINKSINAESYSYSTSDELYVLIIYLKN